MIEILTKLPPKLTVSQWADSERMLPRESSPFAGRWKTERAQFQKGIMDTFSDPKVERIVCMTASQVGKTEILNNICTSQEKKGKPLKTVDPDIMHHIDRFENLNDFDKPLIIETTDNVPARFRRRKKIKRADTLSN